MREISANADSLPKSFKCSSIGTSLLIIKLKVFMDKVANRLNTTADDEFLLLGRSGMKPDKLKNGWSESGFRTYPFLARDAITE